MKVETERRYYCDDCGEPVQDPAPKPPTPPFRYVDPTRHAGVDMCRSCFRAFNRSIGARMTMPEQEYKDTLMAHALILELVRPFIVGHDRNQGSEDK